MLACSGCASSSGHRLVRGHQRRLAGLHRRGQGPDLQLVGRVQPPTAGQLVAAALYADALACEVNHEGVARHEQGVEGLAVGVGGGLQRPAVVLQRMHQRGIGLAPGRLRRRGAGIRRGLPCQHPVRCAPRRHAAVAVEQQQPAFTDAELTAAAVAFKRDGVAGGVPAEGTEHRLRRDLAVQILRAQREAAVVLQRQPHADARAVGAGRHAFVGACPVEGIATVVRGVGHRCAATLRHAACQTHPAGQNQPAAPTQFVCHVVPRSKRGGFDECGSWAGSADRR